MNVNIDLNIKVPKEVLEILAESVRTIQNIPLIDNQEVPVEQENISEKKEPKPDSDVKEPKKPKSSKKETVEAEEVPAITLEVVRGKLASLSQNGKQAQVKALIKNFGASKLSDIPKEKYQELLKQAEEI